jgi:hypothetical protein
VSVAWIVEESREEADRHKRPYLDVDISLCLPQSQLAVGSGYLNSCVCHYLLYSQAMAFYPSPKSELHAQEAAHRHSLDDPESFWAHEAAQLQWHKLPSAILQESEKTLKSGVFHPTWSWFPDGELSTCFNCVDRHVQAGRGESLALIWDSPVTGSKLQFTYNQLLHEVETLAGVLREQGVGKGDVVLIYSQYFRNI